MNWIDILIIIPVLWFAFKGFKNGLIKELATLAALLLGVWVASEFSYFVANILKEKTELDENYLPIIAFAIVFIITVILVHLLAKSLNSLVKAIALEWLNKIAGIAFGAIKALVIIAALIYVLEHFINARWDLIPHETINQSLLYTPVNDLIEWVYPKLKELNTDEFTIQT